jgi:ribosomal protein S6--L-glutamate ligase
MVINGKVVAAMAMTPVQGDFRANFHLTRESRPIEMTQQIETLAVKAAQTLTLDIAGVDMIVDSQGKIYLIEVNYAPGFKGLEKATGLDIAGLMIDCAVARGRSYRSLELQKTDRL